MWEVGGLVHVDGGRAFELAYMQHSAWRSRVLVEGGKEEIFSKREKIHGIYIPTHDRKSDRRNSLVVRRDVLQDIIRRDGYINTPLFLLYGGWADPLTWLDTHPFCLLWRFTSFSFSFLLFSSLLQQTCLGYADRQPGGVLRCLLAFSFGFSCAFTSPKGFKSSGVLCGFGSPSGV